MSRNFLILGAGIAGLTLGCELARRGAQVWLVERNSQVGGLIRTKMMQGVPLDSGPHLFHSAHSEIVQYWRDIVGDRLQEREFYAGNYLGGRIYDYPVNKKNLRTMCTDTEYLRICHELEECAAESALESRSYYEYVRKLCGHWLSESFFTKYPEKLWGIPTTDLSARFAPKRIAINENRKGFHSGPGRFVGVIDGGCGVLTEGLKDRFLQAGGKLSLQCSVDNVLCESGRVKTICTSQGEIDCRDRVIVSTLPLDTLGKLAGVASNLYYRSCYCVNFLLKRDPFPDEYDWLYFSESDVPFHRAGLQTRFSRRGVPDGMHLLCCEIAYTDPPSEMQVEQWNQESLDYLVAQGFLNAEDVLTSFHLDLGPVYPAMYVGHEAEVARVRAAVEKNRNLFILGSLAEYEYSDAQILTAKAIDLAGSLFDNASLGGGIGGQQVGEGVGKLEIFGHTLGVRDQSRSLIIGEIGLAHNGSFEKCKNLILAAKETGFDAVKLQTYGENRLSSATGVSRYFEETLDQELPLDQVLRDRILTPNELAMVFKFAKDIDIPIFSTPFDVPSVALLESMGVEAYKISSMDVLNTPLLRAVGGTGKPVLISTGMATMGDIEFALSELSSAGASNIGILHCVSAYPCPAERSDLGRIRRLEAAFNCPVGYSDHTDDVFTPAIAVALGAKIIEKHITLDRGMDGPDHAFSLTPDLMANMVRNIRTYESAFGVDGIGNIDHNAKRLLRRSIYAKVSLRSGDVLTESTMDVRSPGDGLSPRYYYSAIGKRLKRSIESDNPISFEDIDW